MTTSRARPCVWGVVPAAGLSRRMGFPKQTAKVAGATMVSVVVRTLLDAGIDGVVVVTRTELVDALALPENARVRVAINDDPGSEMIDSCRIGCTALTDVHGANFGVRTDHDGVLVVPADMPSLSAATCRACKESFADDPQRIVIAAYNGKRGHPIVFPLALRGEATALVGGLRMLPRAFPDRVFLLETPDEGVTLDVDTPSEYDQLE